MRYACLGCDACYPALAESALAEAFPEVNLGDDLRCGFQVKEAHWPPVVGEYVVLDAQAPVAVSTLSSAALAGALAHLAPSGLAIVGRTETENIGLDKVVKNIVTNPAIRYLVIAGIESDGHQSGEALLALAAQGVDDNGRIIGSTAKRPVLRNVSREDVNRFRDQIQLVDLRGCDDVDVIADRVTTLATSEAAPGLIPKPGTPVTRSMAREASFVLTLAATESCSDPSCSCHAGPASDTRVVSPDPGQTVVLDRAGYFVILPLQDRGVIHVEHYSYDHVLHHAIEGPDVRALYLTIVQNGWVTELSHAAYLGKELSKADLSLQYGFTYVQDAA